MTAEIGDNVLNSTAQGRLRTIVSRIERLNEDKDAITGDIREVYLEAKGEGFDVKIVRAVVRMRKEDRAKRQEHEALIDLYMSAIGEGSFELRTHRYSGHRHLGNRSAARLAVLGAVAEMTPAALSTALAALTLTREEFAAHINRDVRTVRRWLNGEYAIPPLVEREVAFMLAEKAGR